MVDDLGAMKEPAASRRCSEGEALPQYPEDPGSPAVPRSRTPAGRLPADQPRPTASADGLADRRSRDGQPPAAEPPAWRVLLAYARPYRLTLIGGGLLSLACGCQKVSRRLRAADSPKEVFTQMIGGWRYDWSI